MVGPVRCSLPGTPSSGPSACCDPLASQTFIGWRSSLQPLRRHGNLQMLQVTAQPAYRTTLSFSVAAYHCHSLGWPQWIVEQEGPAVLRLSNQKNTPAIVAGECSRST